MPKQWACRKAGSRNGSSACRKRRRRMKPSCTASRERASTHLSASARWWSTASSRCAISPLKAWDARRDPKPCSTISPAMWSWPLRASDSRVRVVPSIASCVKPDASSGVCLPSMSRWMRPAPMSQWQLDFKDASSVPAQPDGKRQHVVEVLNTVDMGTSVLVSAQVRADFTAETTLEMVADLVRTHGCPRLLTVDRDVRFVSSPHGSDFPSALVRFCHCLGIAVRLCDPQHPQQNGFVERSHRSSQQECLAV